MAKNLAISNGKKDVEAVMPLGSHLDELRKRVLYAIYGLAPVVGLALVFGKEILGFLLRPLFDALDAAGLGAPQATGPLETFSAYIKVSLITSIIIGGPWLLYQLWLFVAPGLYSREKRFIYFLLPLSFLLTLCGVSFLYRFVMPMMLSFFLAFGNDIGTRPTLSIPVPEGIVIPTMPVLEGDPPRETIKPGMYWLNRTLHEARFCLEVVDSQPVIYGTSVNRESGIRQDYRVIEYMNLLLSLLLAFAVSFQTPIVVLLLGWVGLITQDFLRKYRKHALLVTAVVAGMLTPGDVGSMMMLWVPLFILYELGGLLLRFFPASRVAGAKVEDPNAAV